LLLTSPIAIALGTFGGMALSILEVNPIKLVVFAAVISGIVAGPFLILVMTITSKRHIMGAKYVNGKLEMTLGWTTTGLMTAAALALFATGGMNL
jgi:Mn2+/Fe2+ NRAMP family transporter